MSNALIEFGIGETRAIVLGADSGIAEAYIERDGGWRAGDVREVRLTTILAPGVRGIVGVGGVEALLEPLPRALTEGMTLRVEVVREALAEAGRLRLAKVIATTAPVGSGPVLADRLRSSGVAVREASRHGPDLFEAVGWSEVVEAALTGHVLFSGGSLTISPTPAMTVIDVDGALPPVELALAAADAASAAIRRFDLTGSIGIDFPTVADKAARTAIGARLDVALPQPFERTAVNGFGFAQIVRPRLRASLVEVLRVDPHATAALRLLRQAERGAAGRCTLVAAAPVIAWLDARPELVAELARRVGGTVALRVDPSPTTSGHVAP
ncbi:ribonuclease E/G [Glacieibacterium megasporae]|uniref:ribonuclease E/G n=1 Tax=Glacieibacterium megasporae TaxID=2835787 RepID=UPI001C1E3F0D|nr:ribonuclease E/G [Polymorphobacter megasporae]UAJ10943.1 ribonuclease E/G [Polymorphobacter megasporae]